MGCYGRSRLLLPLRLLSNDECLVARPLSRSPVFGERFREALASHVDEHQQREFASIAVRSFRRPDGSQISVSMRKTPPRCGLAGDAVASGAWQRQCIFVRYNCELKPLEKLLSRVRCPGDFFVQGAMEAPMPRVEIEGVGVLSFPIPDAQMRLIVGQATAVPYGRGEQTLVDPSVRETWQLPPAKVRVGANTCISRSTRCRGDLVYRLRARTRSCESVALAL